MCPHIPKWMYNKGLVITPPVKIAWHIGWENMGNYQYMHVIDVVTDWSYALV